ncbi:helix-turn-helix domain-containing protein [Peribacillus huizhouensis]|uniref:Transcriptional regulator with XRE-family HTH domain n=1 Tax=Peribacillus huizhouensis TaxID=1501239 RepID=A0ABR6CRG8_9BACI|nr:helix-turn-helix transcriptional regulator [Peribacillus huizhouensis]MBA9027629.1 transcriptional regulator with XRE-family HTH domain [Peribacillus huizhouensis]
MRKEKVSAIIGESHKLMNQVVTDTASILSNANFVYKIDELLNERNITQKDLASMTGMRVGTISQLVNGKTGVSLNKTQLIALMVALRVTKLSDIVDLELPQDVLLKFQKQQAEWLLDKEMPIELKEMHRNNILKANNL